MSGKPEPKGDALAIWGKPALDEMMANLGGEDVAIVRMAVGRGLDPRRTVRVGLDGNGGLLVAGDPEVAAEVINKIHALGVEGKPVEADLAERRWKGEEVGRLYVTLERPALPASSATDSTQTKE